MHFRKEDTTMARDARKHQKALERKAAKRKRQKEEKSRGLVERLVPTSLRKAKSWPLQEVLLSQDW